MGDTVDPNLKPLQDQLHAALQMVEGFNQSGSVVPEGLTQHLAEIQSKLAELNPPISKEIGN